MAYQPSIYGVVSTVNSTVVNLAGAAIFTGTSEDITAYSNIKVSVFSSHVSAIDGLSIQQSIDGTNWDATDIYSIPATTYKLFSVGVNSKFFRIVYTNGATLTTSLRIQVIYHTADKQPSSVRPQDGRANDNDFVETLGFLMGYNSATNAWDRLRTSIANGLQVDVTRMPVTSVTGAFFQATQPVSGAFFQATQPVSLAVNTPVIAAGANSIGNINELRASTLTVTATGLSGAAVTLTLPAVAAQFHYITSISIAIYATAARTGAATPLVVTTTNITGAPAFTFETAQAIGTNTPTQGFDVTVRSAVVNTATTIVAPIATAGIWRITVTYFTGA